MLRSLQIVHLTLLGLSGVILSLELMDILPHSVTLSAYKLLSVGIIGFLFTLIIKLTKGTDSSYNFLVGIYRRMLFNKAFLLITNLIFLSYFVYSLTSFLTTREIVFMSANKTIVLIFPEEFVPGSSEIQPIATFEVVSGNPASYRANTGVLFFKEISNEKEETRVIEVKSILQKWNISPVTCE